MSKKNKTFIALAGILLLLSGGYYGSTVWKQKKTEEAAPAYTPAPTLGNFENSALVKIEAPGLTLTKNGEIWELASFEGNIPAAGIELDQGKIQTLTYFLATVMTDRIVEETPSSLSTYGLDTPSARTIVTDSAGKKAEYLLGDMTPSRTSYYMMEEGKPAVYAVSSSMAENVRVSLDAVRQKVLFPAFEPAEFTGLRLERAGNAAENRAGTSIEIAPKPNPAPPYLTSAFSSHILTSPYLFPRMVDPRSLETVLGPFNNLAIEDFIDDAPSSLRPYGLDEELNQPFRILFQTREKSLELLVGDATNGKHYAKLAGAPGVFTVGGLDNVINVKPFDLVDKFIALINIDSVDHLLVRGGERELSADFRNTEDDEIYSLNGRKAEPDSFKDFYQAVIGLLADAEYPASSGAPPVSARAADGNREAETGEIHIEFTLNTPAGMRVSVALVPYNRDFYAVRQEGATEFLVSRNQVRNIYGKADAVTYTE